MFIDQKFSNASITAVKLLGLIPSILCYSKPVDLSECVSQYSSSLELFKMEIQRWKNHYMQKKHKEGPSSAADAIKECDKDTVCSQTFMFCCRLPAQCQSHLVNVKEMPVC